MFIYVHYCTRTANVCQMKHCHTTIRLDNCVLCFCRKDKYVDQKCNENRTECPTSAAVFDSLLTTDKRIQ